MYCKSGPDKNVQQVLLPFKFNGKGHFLFYIEHSKLVILDFFIQEWKKLVNNTEKDMHILKNSPM